ncbi:aminotransferase class I/II-fold pyridoxal phosphate-dependent enzyme [Oleiphilus sp. HI0066]|uniref:aminotransferase class I/II-fold pyridoxal phosphate-dependent enzyme n=1 Tax=Oleiphilus sp. HI0066 TaxID=1822242 RepID=UPI0018D4492F|nr:aminotransferase class I/II-fold pyridoxal phosphate-dependent enzyme [Oleiphilus sp. HI0066]
MQGSILDLSSAVNPFAYDKLDNEPEQWKSLPNISPSLKERVAQYYDNENFLLTPGSQWAIEYLPKLFKQQLDKSLSVAVPSEGYAEHRYHWQKVDARLYEYDVLASNELIEAVDICVVINPNNPSGDFLTAKEIITLAERMTAAGKWMIIDEAFVDFHHEFSVSSYVGKPGLENLIVLRSFGKFSGLPGARIGAVGVSTQLRHVVKSDIPLWGISGPSLTLFERVVADQAWLRSACEEVTVWSRKLDVVLRRYFSDVNSAVKLFSIIRTPDALIIFERLLSDGVYVRLLDNGLGLRVSVPKNEAELNYLETALARAFNREDISA